MEEKVRREGGGKELRKGGEDRKREKVKGGVRRR